MQRVYYYSDKNNQITWKKIIDIIVLHLLINTMKHFDFSRFPNFIILVF